MDTANVNRLLLAAALRAFGDGFVSLLLPLYLLELGYDTHHGRHHRVGHAAGLGRDDARASGSRRIATTTARCCSPRRR